MIDRHDPIEKAKRAFDRKESKIAQSKSLENQDTTVIPKSLKTDRPKPGPLQKSLPAVCKPAQTFPRGKSHSSRRAIPAHVRHRKWQSCAGQCEAVSPDGKRCREKRWLELHHIIPVSRDGANSAKKFEFRMSWPSQVNSPHRFSGAEFLAARF